MIPALHLDLCRGVSVVSESNKSAFTYCVQQVRSGDLLALPEWHCVWCTAKLTQPRLFAQAV